MDTSNYQSEVQRTMGALDETGLLGYTLGICGEAGEIAEHIKKWGFHGQALDRDYLAAECGDVIWYVTALLDLLGLDLGEVMAANLAKLERRYPAGFVPGGGNREEA